MLLDYNLAIYIAAVMGNFLSAITIYFSIGTAYVVAAFVAGTRLSKLQLSIVNASFTIAAGIIGTLSVLIFSRVYKLAAQNQGSEITAVVDFTFPLAALVLMVYVGCLVFMWSIRRKHGDE